MFKQKTLLCLLAVFCSVIFASQASAIGMVTEPIVLKDVLRGQGVVQTLTLLNSENQSAFYELKAEGEIADWAKFYLKEDTAFASSVEAVEVPANAFFDVMVLFTAPKEARNGVYTGDVAILSIPNETEDENMVGIRQKVEREVSIEITDKEIVDLEASVIPKQYWIGQGKNLDIKVIYENKGNIEVRPTAELTILKEDKTVFQALFPYPADEIAVKPQERKIFDPLLTWQSNGQPTGQYIAKVKILLGDEVIQEEEFRFDILSITDNLLALVSKIGFGSLGLGWFLVGCCFIALALAVALFSKKVLFINFFKSRFAKKSI